MLRFSRPVPCVLFAATLLATAVFATTFLTSTLFAEKSSSTLDGHFQANSPSAVLKEWKLALCRHDIEALQARTSQQGRSQFYATMLVGFSEKCNQDQMKRTEAQVHDCHVQKPLAIDSLAICVVPSFLVELDNPDYSPLILRKENGHWRVIIDRTPEQKALRHPLQLELMESPE
ncbi:MAG: hypothetical protein CMN76_01380 [Spirochaetaceae bacterium]|nr:hypothetical protein [Spirochaetaceae bacterium]|tara:strand:+ start:44786 stop:45310 length:525 start_codon:yes stop_codon:yes gene_type:complete